jgi:hypothetical protein
VKYDRYTYEQKRLNGWVVYGWGTYSSGSVLAGQPKKQFLDSFDTEDEARAAYPDARPGSKWTDPQVSLAHLPGENDPVPGGMYPDDI